MRPLVVLIFASQLQGNQTSDEVTSVTFVNNNNHIIEQYNERKDRCDCSRFFGSDFKECMAYVTPDSFVQNLDAIGYRGIMAYAQNLEDKEIVELKKSFDAAAWEILEKQHPYFTDSIDNRYTKFLALQETIQAQKGLSPLGFLLVSCGLFIYHACKE